MKIIGQVRKAEIDFRYRRQGMEQFEKEDIFREIINNVVEDAIENNLVPILKISYFEKKKRHYLMFVDDGSGLRIGDFIKFGVSRKKNMLGRYGHGAKDAALMIGEEVVIASVHGSYVMYQDANLVPYYGAVKGLGIKKGTTIIIKLKKDTLFDIKGIKKIVKDYAKLALYWKKIELYVNDEKMTINLPQAEDLSVNLGKRKVNGVHLPRGRDIKIYTQGGYLLESRLVFDIDGDLLLNMDSLTEDEQFFTPLKKLRLSNPIWKKQIEPSLVKWMKEEGYLNELLKYEEENKRLSYFLKPLLAGEEIVGGPPTDGPSAGPEEGPKREYVESGKYAGRPRGGGPSILTNSMPRPDCYIGTTPESLIRYINHPLHEQIKMLPKKYQIYFTALLCAERATFLASEDYDNSLEKKRKEWKKIDRWATRLLKRLH